MSKALTNIAVPKAAAEDWPSFVKLVASLRKNKPGWPVEFQMALQWYEPHLIRLYDDATIRLRDLVQLEQIAATYKSRQKFLTELTLDPPDATTGQGRPPINEEDYLTLSTIHSAKGREWKCVHILNVVDGCIPSDLATGTAEEIEEERRLLYGGNYLLEKLPQSDGAAAILHPQARQSVRPPSICLGEPLHPREHSAAIRPKKMD